MLDIFVATAVLFSFLHPTPWTEEMIDASAEAVHERRERSGEYIIEQQKDYLCVSVEGLYAEPYCNWKLPSYDEAVNKYKEAMIAVMKNTGQLQ